MGTSFTLANSDKNDQPRKNKIEYSYSLPTQNASNKQEEKLENGYKIYENDKETLKAYAKLLYAQGCLISGVSVKDPAELSSLIVDLMIK